VFLVYNECSFENVLWYLHDVRGSVHHNTIHEEKSYKTQQCFKIFIPYLYEAQHVRVDTPRISRSLKLHYQPLVFHTWKVVGRVVSGRCQAVSDNVHQPHVQQPSTYEKPESASAVLGSC